MNITEAQRVELETSLDRLFYLASKHPEYRFSDARLYEKSCAIVRETNGHRRLRSDFNGKKPDKQATLDGIESTSI